MLVPIGSRKAQLVTGCLRKSLNQSKGQKNKRFIIGGDGINGGMMDLRHNCSVADAERFMEAYKKLHEAYGCKIESMYFDKKTRIIHIVAIQPAKVEEITITGTISLNEHPQ